MGQRESVGGGQLLVPEVGPACPGSRLFPAVAGGAVPPAHGSRPVGWAASRPGSDVPPLPRRMTRVDLRSYLQRIYNVPVAAVRTRVQHGGCPGLAAAPLPAARVGSPPSQLLWGPVLGLGGTGCRGRSRGHAGHSHRAELGLGRSRAGGWLHGLLRAAAGRGRSARHFLCPQPFPLPARGPRLPAWWV